jgi:replicative DNA helicase Mcm
VVKHSRESVGAPRLPDDVRDRLLDFYQEVRSLNDDDENSPVSATPRKLEAGIRLAAAFARLRLAEEISMADAEMAISLTRSLIGQTFDPDAGMFDADRTTEATEKSQRDRIKSIQNLIAELQDEYDDGAPLEEVLDESEANGMGRSKAKHEIEKLKQQGDAYAPEKDTLRLSRD